MDPEALTEVVRDVGVLLALALLFDLVRTRFPLRARPYRSVVVGLAVGLVGVAIMAQPYELQPGVVFDARSVVLALSGLFFGAVATGVAVIATAAYRLHVGGSGALTGVLVILWSGLIGIAWRYWKLNVLGQLRAGDLYLFGLVVHLGMLALMFSLPAGLTVPVFTTLAPPILLVFPLATAALGLLMVDRLKREQLAARLDASEARYRSLFENDHAPMLVIDPADGRIVDSNPAAARFYGWSRAELAARSIAEINTLPEAQWREEMQSARSGERSFFRSRHRRATGEIRDVEVKSGEVCVDGRPLLYSIIHDVTSERMAREALRLRSAALDAAANAIMITDRSGSIEWVNSAFTRLYGYTWEEVIGKNPRDLVKSDVQGPDFYAGMWHTLLAGRTWRGRITNRRKDGSHVEEELTITPVREEAGGEITHFIAVKHDLTDWRELERRLAMAQKLESVGQLAGGVAHDFNNLLTVINGSLDLVLGEIDETQQIRSDLEEARRAGGRASALTRQLLAFSGRQVLRKESIDLNALIDDIRPMLQRLIGPGIGMAADLDGQLAPVFADRGQLEQVIMNLAVNARDAMSDGGMLTITTRNVAPQAVEERPVDGVAARHVCLSVHDTGTGIDPAIQSRVFDPFFTTKEVGKGTGLGLATVYGIVTHNGGTVQLQSNLGEGTTFEILLPAGEPEHGPLPAPSPPHRPERAGSETILVAEDEPAIRRMAERMLQSHGYSVLSAGSGAEALEILTREGDSVALLFTDIVMPGMSGIELEKRAVDLRPGLRVVFTSGYTEQNLTRHAMAEDHRFLAKPYSLENLAATVRSALDG
jgi:two-component system, cell cycle sensor histidine kinase and response regulator CckA